MTSPSVSFTFSNKTLWLVLAATVLCAGLWAVLPARAVICSGGSGACPNNDGQCAGFEAPGASEFCHDHNCICWVPDPGVCPDRCNTMPYCPFSGVGVCGGHAVFISGTTTHVTDCRCIRTGLPGGCLSYCDNIPPACVPATGSACLSGPNICGMRNSGTITAACGCNATTPPDSLCGNLPTGSFSAADCAMASGTATDLDSPGPISVHLYVDGVFASVVTANAPTPSWAWPIPAAFKNGIAHTIRAYAINVPAGVNPELASAKTITCSDPPTGSFSTASCSTDAAGAVTLSVSGTASDNQSVAGVPIKIFDTATALQVGSGTAAQVSKAFNFSMSVAPPITGGAARTYTLRAYAVDIPTGINQQLLSDQTVTCNPPAPTVTISAVPPTLPYNSGSSNITWSSTQAATCTGSAGSGVWAGPRTTAGVFSTGPLLATTNYTITCSNAAGSVTATAIVTVGAPPPPVISGTTQPDFCSPGPSTTVSWNSLVQPQTAYQIQLATDPLFAPAAIKYDSMKIPQFVARAHLSWYARLWQRVIQLFTANAATSSSALVPVGTLAYNTTYYARVQVWDVSDTPSGWSGASAPIVLPPAPYPTIAMTVTPDKPIAKTESTFSDTTAYAGDAVLVRSWDFGDGIITAETPGSGTIGHTYADASSSMGATLTVTTASMLAGQSCSVTVPFTINKPIPQYREVLPGLQSSPR